MSKAKTIRYNPALSVAENATKNGVSNATIRSYLQDNDIDRRYDRKQNLIADCKAYLKKHPNASRNELQRKTGHSLTTIRKYWKYISTETVLTDFNIEKQQKRLLRQSNNFYATHPSVTQDLLREEQFHKAILEPFCGGGTMAEVIIKNGYEVEAYDLIDRGYGKVGDFFTTVFPNNVYDIITNPPYDDRLIDTVKRCLSLCKNKVAILLPIQYLSGKERHSELYAKFPPSRVYIYCERINIAKDGDFEKYSDSGSNMTIYGWYVWEKGYKGETELRWIHNDRDGKLKKGQSAVKTKKNPDSTNLNKVLKDIPNKDIFEYLENATTKKDKKVKDATSKVRELWSNVLKDIPRMFEKADADDVTELREFLREKPEMPMLFIGSGGQQGFFPAFLYSITNGVGMALTPLQFASLSDATVKHSRLFLLSRSGGNDDIRFATKRAVLLNPDNTACLTTKQTDKNCFFKFCKGTSAKVFFFNHSDDMKSGFLGIRGKFYKYALFYKAFSGVESVSSLVPVNLEYERCFKYELNRDSAVPVSLEWVEHFCILYSGYGEPVARDFESVMAEAGMGSVQVCDYRNFCHGRFVFPSNFTENDREPRYRSDVAMVLLVTPRDRKLAEDVRGLAISSKTPVITIETEFNSALASIDLLIKTHVLIGYIGEQGKRTNPHEPYNFNSKDVRKEFPKNRVKFIQEQKANGNLVLIEKAAKEPKQ